MEAEKYIPTLRVAAAKRELTIHDLDNDSLGIIFNQLSNYRDRVSIGSVCKRWHDVSKANWCSYPKHLIIDLDNFPSWCDYNMEKTKNILEKTLQLRGHYLEEISIIGYSHYFKEGTIKRIIECCPRLKRLTTGLVPLNAVDWLACSNLEALTTKFPNDNDLSELIRRNKRLRQLKIDSSFDEGSIFDHLDPSQLEILHIPAANFVITTGLANKLAESLVDLNYGHIVSGISNFQPLSMLKNLRTLNLKIYCANRLDTQFIVDIAKNCKKLECIELYIYADGGYDQNFIALLFKLPCLKSLILMLNQYKMTYQELDRLFQKAPNLELCILSSYCYSCTFDDESVPFCLTHRENLVKNTNGVIISHSYNYKAVIITASPHSKLNGLRKSEALAKGARSCLYIF